MRWFRRQKKAAYSDELAMLRDYLAEGVDPFDFPHLLEKFYEEAKGGLPRGFVDGDQYLEEMGQGEREEFKKWLEKGHAHDSPPDAFSPTYMHVDYKGIVRRPTWLVHFSDSASDIASKGFAVGHDDPRTLGLTTHFLKRKENQGPGWNFAFVAGSRDASRAAYDKKYGKHAVMFQSAGVKVYHYGDEENQVIFYGPMVREVIPLYKDDGGSWVIESSRDGRKMARGDFPTITSWVMRNYQQYRGVISRAV